MTFCLICDNWLPYCQCTVRDRDQYANERAELVFEATARRYKEMIQRAPISNPQPKEPVFTPEDAIYAHSLGVLL